MILLLAAALRLPGLGSQSLWFDEVFTARLAEAPLRDVVRMVRQTENTPPLYYLVENLWAHLAGSSDAMLRLPAALFGIAGVLSIYLFARQLFGVPAGLTAALLLAVSPFHIAYSQEARAYTLMFLLAALSCWSLAILLRSRSTAAQIGYVLFTAAMFWSQPFGILVVLAQDVYLTIALATKHLKGDGIGVGRWLLLQCAAAVLFGPWVAQTLQVASTGEPWIQRMSLATALRVLIGPPAVSVPTLLLCAAGIGWAWRRRELRVLLVLLLALVPAALPLALSSIKPVFVPRYAIPSLIGFYALSALGVMILPRIGAVVLPGILSVVMIVSLPRDFWRDGGAYRKADVRGAVADVRKAAADGETLYCINAADRLVAQYYLERTGIRVVPGSPMPQAVPAEGRVWLLAESDAPPASAPGFNILSRRPFEGLQLVELRKQPQLWEP